MSLTEKEKEEIAAHNIGWDDVMKCKRCQHYDAEEGKCKIKNQPTNPNDSCNMFELKKGLTEEEAYKETLQDYNTKKQAQTIVEDEEVFRDDKGEYYCKIKVENHTETWQLFSEVIKNYYAIKLHEEDIAAAELENKKPPRNPPSRERIRSHLQLLAAQAMMQPPRKISYKVAWHEGNILLDLKNHDWKALVIKKDATISFTDAADHFYRLSHDKEFEMTLPIPDIETSRQRLKEFINNYCRVKEKQDKQLLLVDMIVSLIPEIPKTILIFYGDQGSAKTTTMMFIKKLLDPSGTDLQSIPPDKEELLRVIGNNYVCFFDNITSINNDQSDTFCRVVTGASLQRRKLYTDNDNLILQFYHKIGMNGINIAGTNPDFLDRALPLEMARIPANERKTIGKLTVEFENDAPKLRSALVRVLAETYKERGGVKVKELPRMADYAMWGEAASRALGYEPMSFVINYLEKIRKLNITTIESNPVIVCLLKLLKSEGGFEGSPTELLNRLTSIAEISGINTNSKTFPKSPHILTRRLNTYKVNLAEEGWVFESFHDGEERIIRFNATNAFFGKSNGSRVDEVTNATLEKKGDNDQHNLTLLTLPNATENQSVIDDNIYKPNATNAFLEKKKKNSDKKGKRKESKNSVSSVKAFKRQNFQELSPNSLTLQKIKRYSSVRKDAPQETTVVKKISDGKVKEALVPNPGSMEDLVAFIRERGGACPALEVDEAFIRELVARALREGVIFENPKGTYRLLE